VQLRLQDTLVRLDRILEELVNIRHRLDDIERTVSSWNPQPLPIPESELFSLPDNLRKTYLIIASKGECSATQVSVLTGRSRAIESSYLNQLARMGWLIKRRNSKTLQFRAFTSLKERHGNMQTPVLLRAQPDQVPTVSSRNKKIANYTRVRC
jgi:hypothetical protein